QSLESGRWFTLDPNGARVQVQYVWHSRRKHLHLFASLDGHCYLLQAQRMATSEIRIPKNARGTARISLKAKAAAEMANTMKATVYDRPPAP
ncbi:MAG: DUF1631 domain-containing protein, partial [Candidatus Hydrogenedentes bacterium]|nr:DUF1631 domain-containing protein [Candidatus Hydrogenedentota bacterium]